MKILHITPHLGGGVGNVIINWILNDKSNTHSIMSFGYSYENIKSLCNENNIPLTDNVKAEQILNVIPDADIVIVHYWNFPTLIKFLVKNKLPDCRLITWCHISGFHGPYTIPDSIVEMSDKFVFTSPISYDLDVMKSFPKEKFTDIWSTRGTEKYQNVVKKEHDRFNILYAGTLDFSKLDCNFALLCHLILQEIPEASFIVCGTGSHEENLKRHLEGKAIRDKFQFTGWVDDLTPYFEIADVFLYPMQFKSFSTCEQVLGEAMMSGIIPVVFNNKAELEIVKNEVTGFVVDNIDECVDKIVDLYKNKKINKYSQLSENAKLSALEKYSMGKMVYKWNKLFDEIIKEEKTEKQWKRCKGGAYERGVWCFLESLDNNTSKLFSNYIESKRAIKYMFIENPQWHSKSKGSVYQYLEYFSKDEYLNDFKRIMEEIE